MCENHSIEPESTKSHKKESKKRLSFAILTISDSKYKGKGIDKSGATLVQSIRKEGHRITKTDISGDDRNMIEKKVTGYLKDKVTDIIITTGGTGLTKNDITIETIKPLFEKEITGFSPLFMKLSYEKIGPACMLSRATAGIKNGKAIFCLPGSPDACSLATEKMILKEASHILKHAGE